MLRHGTWQLLETYNWKATAEQNVKYVGEVLGLPSKLMIRDLDSPAHAAMSKRPARMFSGGSIDAPDDCGTIQHRTLSSRSSIEAKAIGMRTFGTMP